MNNNQKQTYSAKETKLSFKLSKIISLFLIFIFLCIIAVVIVFSSKSITNAINGEFQALSKAADEKVENILTSAKSAADSIISYLQKAYLYQEQDRKNMLGERFTVGSTASNFKSSIYHSSITELSSDIEQYITEVIRQTSSSNPDIVGMGALFAPYAFDKNIESYAFYVLGAESDKDIQPYGVYEEYSKDEYYTKVSSSMQPEFTAPYDDQGVKMVTYSAPIIYKGELKGIITADINITNFDKAHAESNSYPSMYTTILNENNIIIYDSEDVNNAGKSLSEFLLPQYLSIVETKMQGSESFELVIKRGDGTKETCYFNPITIGNIKWWALSALENKDKNKAVIQTLIVLIILTLLSVVSIVGVMFYITKKMLKPIDSVLIAAENIAKGDFNIELEVESNDEIGKLAKAFQFTSNSLKAIIQDENYLLEEMADGNFNVKSNASEYYIGEFAPILSSLNNINNKLSQTLGQIHDASAQVFSASDQMANAAQSLASGSTEQAGAVEELLATINEVSSQVEENAKKAVLASEEANSVNALAKESNAQMENLTAAMYKINDASKQIVEIINVIESISSQTNLLSLNAAIEAARAGEAGKGFAVVAEEIRELANQSSIAANNTRELIETAAAQIKNGNKITTATAQSLEKVAKSILQIVAISDSVKIASEGQAASMKEVNTGIEQISEVVQSNSATAQETSATSEELSAQAEELNSLVAQFNLKL